MADDITAPGTGETLAFEEIASKKYAKGFWGWGPAGTYNKPDVASGKPFPVQVRGPSGGDIFGEPADDKSSATDTTPVKAISLWKQISATLQSLLAGAATLESGRNPVNTIAGQAGVAGGSGTIGANTQRFAHATDDPIFTAGALAAAMATQTTGNTSAATNSTGANWTAFGSQACKELTLVNNTGTDLEWRIGATGVAVTLWNGAAFTVRGITNANQVDIRRIDQSNTQVTLAANWVA